MLIWVICRFKKNVDWNWSLFLSLSCSVDTETNTQIFYFENSFGFVNETGFSRVSLRGFLSILTQIWNWTVWITPSVNKNSKVDSVLQRFAALPSSIRTRPYFWNAIMYVQSVCVDHKPCIPNGSYSFLQKLVLQHCASEGVLAINHIFFSFWQRNSSDFSQVKSSSFLVCFSEAFSILYIHRGLRYSVLSYIKQKD